MTTRLDLTLCRLDAADRRLTGIEIDAISLRTSLVWCDQTLVLPLREPGDIVRLEWGGYSSYLQSL